MLAAAALLGLAGGLGLLLGGQLLLVEDRVQAQLAALVDLRQLDLDLVAHAQDVLDVLHALAAHQPADLRDVQQPVLAGGQLLRLEQKKGE